MAQLLIVNFRTDFHHSFLRPEMITQGDGMSLLGAYVRRRRGPIVYGQPTVGDGHLMKVLVVQTVMYGQSMGGRGMVVQGDARVWRNEAAAMAVVG